MTPICQVLPISVAHSLPKVELVVRLKYHADCLIPLPSPIQQLWDSELLIKYNKGFQHEL